MLKWVLTLLLAIFVLGLISPWLQRRFRLGQLPGDLTVCYRGRTLRFPFTTTLLLSLGLSLLVRWL